MVRTESNHGAASVPLVGCSDCLDGVIHLINVESTLPSTAAIPAIDAASTKVIVLLASQTKSLVHEPPKPSTWVDPAKKNEDPSA